ncbi:MAG: glycoside hydrolase family 28 protein [Luteolibacter sp.]
MKFLWTTLALCAVALPLHAQIRYEKISVKAPFNMPEIQAPLFPDKDFDVTRYGAKQGVDITEAIAKAIDACHQAGGGRVVIPEGQWKTGKIYLKSNVNLHLAKDAEVVFNPDPKAYLPAVQSSWEGFECFNYSSLIYAFQCENVAITGEGTLKADMSIWKKWMDRPAPHLEALKKLYHYTSANAPVEERQMAEGENNLRPPFIQFNRCKNVRIEGVKIRNSPFWTVHLYLCDSVLVRGLDIYAHGHNNDGIDPEMTRNLLVENCRFDQGDDAIAIKSGSNHDGWRLNTPSENIVIRNCDIIEGHQLVAIGSELSGGIRNVYVHDCKFAEGYKPFNLLFIKTNIRRGGFVENIHMKNISATSTRDSVLGIETDVLYQWKTLVPTVEERLTKISNIHVSDIKISETGTPFRIEGDKRLPVENVTISNISIDKVHGKKNAYENAKNITETNITIGELSP